MNTSCIPINLGMLFVFGDNNWRVVVENHSNRGENALGQGLRRGFST